MGTPDWDEWARLLVEEGFSFPDFIWEIELALILAALAKTNGNCTQAARMLGVHRTTLVEKRRKHGLRIEPGRCKRRRR